MSTSRIPLPSKLCPHWRGHLSNPDSIYLMVQMIRRVLNIVNHTVFVYVAVPTIAVWGLYVVLTHNTLAGCKARLLLLCVQEYRGADVISVVVDCPTSSLPTTPSHQTS